MTLPSGNPNTFGKPNLWAHIPCAYRADRPLRLAFVFHGHANCLESLVGDAGVRCRPGDAPRIAHDVAAQVDRSGTGAIVLVPQLAYDERHGDPGVLDSGPALEKLAREALEGPLSPALGARRLADVERVAMIAISGGYQALHAVLGAFGDRTREVFLLDAYYAEHGPVDAWVDKHVADFARGGARPRRLGVIYSGLDSTRPLTQAFAARVAAAMQKDGLATSMLHRDVPRDPTVDELATPVAFLFSDKDHDDIPRTDLAKVLAGF
ncbi:MAG: hypothetical protein HYV09_17615 [Deltaproteobacteria bacterium]|nr:hypothetical protein [Deltaproteobacteria bacterium]